MRRKTVALCIVLLSSASALWVPRQESTIQVDHDRSLTRRNETAAMAGELTLNIDPDIDNPNCGGIYEAQISVALAADPFYLSKACQNVLNYLGGNKGKKNVNIVFACTGGSATGVGDRDIKFIFNIIASAAVNGANSGTQLVPSNLEVVNEVDNTFISTQVNLGVKMSGSMAKFQYIYC
ncbi:hypothetical protein A1O7_08088 [Cladophialophora yegresii CBS 114405]|uniref:Ecp2 effector protein domain-containing protein n=1 Tax=Cladophialophora yegresii CBS 114405 TaxID=1182544 RepID=W9VI39_9EURO|nr:uncharacterized protein A1O7_08088 [Cladophialophora yegresii CBS 114405]EXJ55163.1 hypothetical protein A1O7_08088 [Cladophialophora yegresii CBS 114405]